MTDLDILREFEAKPKRHAQTDDFSPGSIVLLVGLIAIIGVLAVQLMRQNQIQPMQGERAPEFTLTAFGEDEAFTLSDYRGQIVIINFWGSWCGPCRVEAPELQAIYEDYQDDGVVVIGVNWLDTRNDALDFIEEFGLTYPNGPDLGERIAQDYNITGAPENFVVGRDGVVVEAIIGQASYAQLADVLDGILAAERIS